MMNISIGVRQVSISASVTVLLLVAVALFSLIVRFMLLGHDLPYYSIDENDVVEPALSHVAGSWHPGWFKYGPLFSYMLAVIYSIQLWFFELFRDWSAGKYFYSVFFDSHMVYYTARLVHFLVIMAAIGLAARFCWRYYDTRTALITLVICVAPLFERLTDFTVRIDTLQGLCALASLYFAVQLKAGEKHYRSYILAGIFAGLAIAVKPLTGLLLLPSLLLAHVMSNQWSRPIEWRKLIKYSLVDNKGFYVLVLSIFMSHSIVNPFSVLDVSVFWQDQLDMVANGQAVIGAYAGYNFSWLFERWGMLLALVALATPLLPLLCRDKYTFVLLAYVLTFVLAFVLFSTRAYWYISILPVVVVLMARLISAGLGKLSTKGKLSQLNSMHAVLLLAGLTVLSPVIKLWFDATGQLAVQRSDVAAQEWIEDKIDSGSGILAIGWYASTLPRIVSANEFEHAKWAEHFMYNRNKNTGWVNEYRRAYTHYSQSPYPKYRLINMRFHYSNKHGQIMMGDASVNTVFDKYLPDLARQYQLNYIVTASESAFTGGWESSNRVTLLQEFGPLNGYRGAEIKIFAINDAPRVENPVGGGS